MVSAPSGRNKAKSDRLTLGGKMCGREFLGSMGVHTQVKFAGFFSEGLM